MSGDVEIEARIAPEIPTQSAVVTGQDDETSLDAIFRKSDAHVAVGDIEAARDVLLGALTTHNKDVKLLLKLAIFEGVYGGDDEALAYAIRARESEPANPDVAGAYAGLLRRMPRYRDALALLTSQPDNILETGPVRSELGHLYEALGWHAKAFKAYGPKDGLDPGSRLVRRRTWLLSGGPLKPLRTIVSEINDLAERGWRIWTARRSDALSDIRNVPRAVVSETQTELDSYLCKLSTIQSWWWIVSRATRSVAFVCGLILACATIFVSSRLMWPHSSLWTAVSITGPDLLLAIIITYGGNYIVDHSRAGVARFLTAIIGYLGLVGIGLVLVASRSSDPWPPWGILGLALLAAAIGSVPLPVANATVYYVLEWSITGVADRDPQIAIIDLLLDVLYETARSKNGNNLGARNGWMRDLEHAAHLVERRLCKAYSCGDPATDVWAVERASGAAAAIRNMNRRIVAPTPRSWERLAAELHYELAALICGNYGALKWSPPPSSKARWSERGRLAARTLVGAGLPIISVLALQPLLKLDTNIFGWAKIASLIWVVLYLLLTIDPTAREKLDTARSFADVMSKKKE